jgi:hypothetical protein
MLSRKSYDLFSQEKLSTNYLQVVISSVFSLASFNIPISVGYFISAGVQVASNNNLPSFSSFFFLLLPQPSLPFLY